MDRDRVGLGGGKIKSYFFVLREKYHFSIILPFYMVVVVLLLDVTNWKLYS